MFEELLSILCMMSELVESSTSLSEMLKELDDDGLLLTKIKNDPISPDVYGAGLVKKPKIRPKTYFYIPSARKNLPYQRRNY